MVNDALNEKLGILTYEDPDHCTQAMEGDNTPFIVTANTHNEIKFEDTDA
jgi:hypothetical protein